MRGPSRSPLILNIIHYCRENRKQIWGAPEIFAAKRRKPAAHAVFFMHENPRKKRVGPRKTHFFAQIALHGRTFVISLSCNRGAVLISNRNYVSKNADEREHRRSRPGRFGAGSAGYDDESLITVIVRWRAICGQGSSFPFSPTSKTDFFMRVRPPDRKHRKLMLGKEFL